jgi:hypothetical protein
LILRFCCRLQWRYCAVTTPIRVCSRLMAPQAVQNLRSSAQWTGLLGLFRQVATYSKGAVRSACHSFSSASSICFKMHSAPFRSLYLERSTLLPDCGIAEQMSKRRKDSGRSRTQKLYRNHLRLRYRPIGNRKQLAEENKNERLRLHALWRPFDPPASPILKSSILRPDFKAAANQRGCFPRPDHVSAGI